MANSKSDPNYKVISENRRARFDYAIEDDLECGVMLLGSEVKSLRVNSANIAESYAGVDAGELWLVNSYIAPLTIWKGSAKDATNVATERRPLRNFFLYLKI